MPFIIDGGGGTPSPTPTPVPAPIATSQVEVYVDNTSTGVATRTGNIAAPFLTIQEALNKIGKPTSSADSLRLMCVHVSSGNYTETLNVPEGRMIKIVCHGWVNFTGNINYLSDGNARLGSGIRSFLSISGIDNNLATSTHIGRQGGMLINGRIVRKGTSVTGITTHDLYLSNVQVTGGIGWDASIAQPGGTSAYLVRSRLQGTTSDQLNDASTGFPLVFQQVEDSKIEGTLKLSRFGGAVRTEFSSVAMTLLQAGGDIPPYGFYDCVWTGTNSITAPANSLKLNGVSFVNSAAVTLSGGVTRQRIEDFTPLATGATDNAVTRFDGTTGLLQTSGVTIDDTNNVKGAASVQLTGGTGTDGTVSWNDGDGTIEFKTGGTYNDVTSGTTRLSVASTGTTVTGNLRYTGTKSHWMGEVYMVGNATATTITNTAKYFKVAGTTIIGNNKGFDNGGVSNCLRYTGAVTRMFHVAVSCSFSTASNSQNVEFAVFKNGVRIDSSVQETKTGTAGDVQSTALHVVATLDIFDCLEVFCRNLSTASNVTVKNLNFFAMNAN